MRTTATLILLLFAAAAGAADLDELGRRLSDPDPEVRERAVKALREVEGVPASKLLVRALGDREPDVREAAVKALGGRRDDVALKALRKAFRKYEDDSGFLATIVRALGDSGDAESAGDIADLLPRSLGADPLLTRAAIDALGQIRSKESMEALMVVLDKAWDLRPQGPEHPEYLGDVLGGLTGQTELPFSRAETWQAWWRHARRNYRSASPDVEDVGNTYRHDGWRFSIEKPGDDRWEFTRPSGAIVRAVFRGPKEEAGFAWVDVLARSALEPEEMELAAYAKAARERMEDALSKIRDERWGEPARCGRASGIRHSATGILGGGSVVRWRTFVCEKNGILYTVSAHVESGAADAVREEVDAILNSFRLLDG